VCDALVPCMQYDGAFCTGSRACTSFQASTHHELRSPPTTAVEERPGERRKTPYSLDINLMNTRLSIAANRRVLNRLSYSMSQIGLTTSRCASPRHARDLSSNFSKILSTYDQDHHCFVAECCTHFLQLLVWERKKKLKLGLKLGNEVKRIPNKYGHICSGFFLNPSPTSPRYVNLTSSKMIYNTLRSSDKQIENVNARPKWIVHTRLNMQDPKNCHGPLPTVPNLRLTR